VIFTGTPAGATAAVDARSPLRPGQVVESWIEGIGTIRNRCT
jgi:2,4-diketo-3-deoxy-L-fuconate hydrolase